MAMAALNSVIHVSYGQYYVAGFENAPQFDFVGFDGLVLTVDPDGRVVDPGWYGIVLTGTRFGWVRVSVDFLLAPPAPPSGSDWEDVVEFSVKGQAGVPVIGTPTDIFANSLPEFSGVPGDDWRVRLHVRGRRRAAAAGDVWEDPIEEHLLQFWPAPPEHSSILKG